eukprot:COSAG06_NODE_54875_length_292_cov_1.005181_1_plen_72_part_10
METHPALVAAGRDVLVRRALLQVDAVLHWGGLRGRRREGGDRGGLRFYWRVVQHFGDLTHVVVVGVLRVLLL